MLVAARGALPRTARLSALVLGTLTLGTAVAPAALAEEAPTPVSDPSSPASSPSESQAAPPEVLTSRAAADTEGAPQAATPAGASFGTGKLHLTLTPDVLPAGRVLALTGAQVELRFSQQLGVPSTASAVCTFVSSGGCVFPAGSAIPTTNAGPSVGIVADLPDDSVFTATLVGLPASGQLLVPTTPITVPGYTPAGAAPAGPGGSALELPVRHGYRTLGVALTGSGPLAGAEFTLCPATAGACAPGSTPVTATTGADGRATFDGGYLPGDHLVVQTRGPGGSPAPASADHPFAVPAAATVTERDAPLRLTVADTTPPVVTPPVVTPPTSTPPTTAAPTTTPGAATVAAATVAAGRQQTITASGFTPGETVRGTLFSTPVDLGTVVADAQGVATFTFTLPAGLEAGPHSVTATGLTSGATSTATFTVSAAVSAAGSPALATTGAEVGPMVGLGVLALGAGAALTVATGRRRQRA